MSNQCGVFVNDDNNSSLSIPEEKAVASETETSESLKNDTESIIESERNAGKGWAVASTVEHFFGLIFVPKALGHRSAR